jgi:NTE family protein
VHETGHRSSLFRFADLIDAPPIRGGRFCSPAREALGHSWRSLPPCGIARSYRGPAGAAAVMERHSPYCRLEEVTIRHEFQPICPSVSVHIVPPPCPQSQASYDYSATAYLIARVRESTRRWIDDHGLER